MHSYTDTARPGGISSTLRRAEAWLDRRGTWAWVGATTLGFIVFWPVGLGLLAYMIWGKRMFSRSCHNRSHAHSDRYGWGRRAETTGNHAFDSYKAEALRRLEDEQQAFEAFLQRLRNSKDKSEFDAFMEERARSTAAAETPEEPESTPRTGQY